MVMFGQDLTAIFWEVFFGHHLYIMFLPPSPPPVISLYKLYACSFLMNYSLLFSLNQLFTQSFDIKGHGESRCLCFSPDNWHQPWSTVHKRKSVNHSLPSPKFPHNSVIPASRHTMFSGVQRSTHHQPMSLFSMLLRRTLVSYLKTYHWFWRTVLYCLFIFEIYSQKYPLLIPKPLCSWWLMPTFLAILWCNISSIS